MSVDWREGGWLGGGWFRFFGGMLLVAKGHPLRCYDGFGTDRYWRGQPGLWYVKHIKKQMFRFPTRR